MSFYKESLKHIVGQSPALLEVLETVKKVASSESTTLISGESGTGKELIARSLHQNSNRSHNSFIPVNCGAIPKELLESEMFGHVKGAFTGATSNRDGRFLLADKGTIFFDEIGDMSPELQVKLLRVLQEKKFEPVGCAKTIAINVRVIAATNIDLEEAIEQGKFREDLFYRLNVIPVHIPPLRERKSDIPILLNHYIRLFNKINQSQLEGLTSRAIEKLVSYRWPGNIRELENLVERLSVLKKIGVIDLYDLPLKYKNQNDSSYREDKIDIPDVGMDFNSAVDSYENALILKALEKTGWNRNQAAILLKLNRTTLVEKIKKKGLKPPSSLSTPPSNLIPINS